MILLVCSEGDLPSVNMRDALLGMVEWEELGPFGSDRMFSFRDLVMISTPDFHIYTDDIDERVSKYGFGSPDAVIFMSKHAAASGEAALTVHPIGNFNENKFGGRERSLVQSSPVLMTEALRYFSSNNDLNFKVCFEVTHHGPWLNAPTFFIEIGSDERNWGNKDAAALLARTLLNLRSNDYPTVVGVAGGHYAPRFTDMALNRKVNFGHMVPSYHIENASDEEIHRMVSQACEMSNTRNVYIHSSKMDGRLEMVLKDFEIVRSSDLESFTGNQ